MALSAWQEQPGSRLMGRPQQVERAGEAIGRPEMPGPTKLVQVHPLLAEIVEEIADWDVPDGNVARAITPKALPSTTPYLIAQYRVPMRSDRHFGSSGYRHRQYGHVVTAVGTGVVTVRPSGPLGLLLVRLKPEAAARLIGERMQEFVNEKFDLGDLFNAGDVSLLGEMLMEASDSATRFARVEKRHLSRCFRAMFGTSPKQFARVARIEKILAMRRGGSAWSDIAYACGFADQAHMINDFVAIVGETPQQLFRTTAPDSDRQENTPIGQLAGPNFF